MILDFDLDGFQTASLIMVTAFVLTVVAMPKCIVILRRIKFGQEVRTDGPKEHLKKQGTPTMGGAVFMTAALTACLVGMLREGGVNEHTLQVMFLTAGFGLIGFTDDYLKIRKHNSDGLKPRQKIIIQLILSLIFCVWVYMRGDVTGHGGRICIPFTGNLNNAKYVDLPLPIFVAFTIFVILGTDNGVNFTDGLDGLNGSVTAVIAAFFVIAGLFGGTGKITNELRGISFMAAAVLGSLLGFLIFNVYPAKIFMGDTGSLSLGGFVAATAVVSDMELYIPIFGFIYMIEVISVIIQVTYFRKTGGKRFFKMAPIHHHFELLGNSETRIVAAFTIATILLCLISFIGIAAPM